MADKKTVVVVGGGFAGYTLIRGLTCAEGGPEVILIDPRRESVFLPLLPDTVAGKVKLSRLLFPLPDFCRRRGVTFINRAAERLAGKNLLVLDDGEEVVFDYLVLACGMAPNFYGDDRAQKIAFTLAGKSEAEKIIGRLEEVIRRGRKHTFLVVGGGYTGVETASALVYRQRKAAGNDANLPFEVKIIELAPKILGNLPEAVSAPVRREVRRLGIDVVTSADLKISEEGAVSVDGRPLSDCTLVWSAGMRTVDFIRGLSFPKARQDRLRVNPDLSLPGAANIFALGDCASVTGPSGSLRMAVQFSWAQGKTAAGNILRLMSKRPTLTYRSRDYGYLVPLASGKAWGGVLGLKVGGRVGSFLHYFMCVYRSLNLKNRMGIVRDLSRLFK